MRDLKILLIPIIIIILLVMGLLFGLRIYGDYHPSNENVKSLNMKNPLEPTKEYYVKTTKPVKDKLLNIDNQGSGFVIDQTKEFKVSFHSDQYRPYFFSRISFSVYGEAISSVYTNKL